MRLPLKLQFMELEKDADLWIILHLDEVKLSESGNSIVILACVEESMLLAGVN